MLHVSAYFGHYQVHIGLIIKNTVEPLITDTLINEHLQ
jgi:hypothetical protein